MDPAMRTSPIELVKTFARRNIHELVKVEHFANKTFLIAAHTLSDFSCAKINERRQYCEFQKFPAKW